MQRMLARSFPWLKLPTPSIQPRTMASNQPASPNTRVHDVAPYVSSFNYHLNNSLLLCNRNLVFNYNNKAKKGDAFSRRRIKSARLQSINRRSSKRQRISCIGVIFMLLKLYKKTHFSSRQLWGINKQYQMHQDAAGCKRKEPGTSDISFSDVTLTC